ncbi:MAG TPA: flagellar basal body P-ring protein FlgI [Bryobacteraceae bacterium]|nr:flagellar basal body P-ring protein FlgI [Bryobacteraceae bacterium]
MSSKTVSLFLFISIAAHAATRLKDIITLEGVRDNQLIGYGLVVGLNGTGDKRQTVFSAQSLTNLLTRMGVTVAPTAILVRNTAAVFVTANLPPFAQPGTRIDVTVSAIGDSTNLQGGMLILTSLSGVDGHTYAVGQGSVVTGGFVAGRGGNNQTVNHPTAGRIPNGAIIERAAPSEALRGQLKLQLREADFTTAARVASVINEKFTSPAGPVANAVNSALVEVVPPPNYKARAVEFLAELENLSIEVDHPGKIIINERTGTIVMGKDVRIAPVSIMHGALTVEIKTNYAVSQPPPLSQGNTAVTPETTVSAKEDKARSVVLRDGATVEDLVKALIGIGSTPRDVIAILQNLRASGALNGDIEVI